MGTKFIQRELDTIEAIVLGIMLYLGWQDTTGKHPIWTAGTLIVIVLCLFENDPLIFRICEAFLITLLPVSYIVFNANVAWGVCLLLCFWNSVDVLHAILGTTVRLKSGLHEAAKSTVRKGP